MIAFRPFNGNLLSALVWACPLRLSLNHISSANVSLLLMTLLGIICRLVKHSQQILRLTIGLFINWGRFLVPRDTGQAVRKRCSSANHIQSTLSVMLKLSRNWRRGTRMRRYTSGRWTRDHWRVGNLTMSSTWKSLAKEMSSSSCDFTTRLRWSVSRYTPLCVPLVIFLCSF